MSTNWDIYIEGSLVVKDVVDGCAEDEMMIKPDYNVNAQPSRH